LPSRLTQKEFEDKIKLTTNGEYIVIGKYETRRTKVKLKHTICNREWEVSPKIFFDNGKRCPYCKSAIKIKSHNDFIIKINEIHDEKYDILSIYSGMRKDIIYKCKKHGELTSKAQTFLKNGCSKCCFDNKSKTNDQFISELKMMHGERIIPLEKYQRSKWKIKFKCECGYEWSAVANKVLRGQGCSVCDVIGSQGEKKIEEYLKNKKLVFTKQYSNEQCKYKYALRFDFYVENYVLIEYDGKQHFEPVDFAGKGEEWATNDFKLRKKQDQIKNDFCIDNNIPLIRIPYWEVETAYILDQTLGYLNIIHLENIDQNLVGRYLVNHLQLNNQKLKVNI
jgi:hypothetical protein